MHKPQLKYLKDYRPPAYWVDSADMIVDLKETDTTITSVLKIRRNPETADAGTPLELNGVNIRLNSVSIDGNYLEPDRYRVTEEGLIVLDVPDEFALETVSTIQPQENDSLEGLYRSGPMFCTQCEAEGFRKITWFPDRPDVMALFSCMIKADREKFPILLSNGNLVDQGVLPGGRHWAKWEDPFRKPSYLFALVAGDLFYIEDTYRTMSDREVTLRIFVEHENKDKCDHAMQALKKAMKWDEERFGREYDLDIYMIVAVNDYNMGAMENKGLNIFNSKYVLARPDTATDGDFWNIDRVVAHEYFHNWTGNRITLRNWFQLSLKEGLTVFRDQEFSADMTSRPVKRIENVRGLRAVQFPEDAGPMAHPVRPASYIKMDNFYTMTVYEKGAEVIRMVQTLLGWENFRKGMDIYFERYDGQAVTLEEFIGAMAEASGRDFGQFMRWYSQAGTPRVNVERRYDPDGKKYSLTLRQEVPPTPDMAEKGPMHIPVAVGLLDGSGRDMPLRLEGENAPSGTTRLLELKESSETFTFVDVSEEPVPSILRDFSAPVRLEANYADAENAFLAAHDSDEFNRWEALQRIYIDLLLKLIRSAVGGSPLTFDSTVIEQLREPLRKTLRHAELDKSFIALALVLPSESELATIISATDPIDTDAIHAARNFAVRSIAEALKTDFEAVAEENRDDGPYEVTPPAVGRRSLKNMALSYLGRLDTPEIRSAIYDQYVNAANMTDTMATLSILANLACDEREKALAHFHEKWKSDPLVLDKWFAIQATSQIPEALDHVILLMAHPAFSIKNPNKVRSLVGAFCSGNPWRFHQPSGKGYGFLADRVLEIDRFNPMIAARLVSVLNHWKKYEPKRKEMMKAQLERIIGAEKLSNNVYEIVSKALA